MNADKRRKMAELEELEREQDRKRQEHERKMREELADPRVQLGIEALVRDRLDEQLAPAADAIAAEIEGLAGMLAELDLIGEENPGTPRWRVDIGAKELVTGIEVEHPEPRLYTRDKDSIIASRMRADRRYEHALLDEHGLPIKWRTAYRPDLN
jgi:hypothetical protein